MKEDKMAVTRGAGSQRTHCLKGSRDDTPGQGKNKYPQRCQDN